MRVSATLRLLFMSMLSGILMATVAALFAAIGISRQRLSPVAAIVVVAGFFVAFTAMMFLHLVEEEKAKEEEG